MTEMWLRLLGIDPGLEVLDARIVFAYGIPLWVVGFLLILLALWSWWTYRRERAHWSRLRRGVFASLRFITWATVLLLLLQPRLEIDRMVEPTGNLAVLFDSSESMALVDAEADADYLAGAAQAAGEDPSWARRATRTEILSQMLDNDELDLMDRLGERYAVRSFHFAGDVHPLDAETAETGNAEAEAAGTLPAPDGEITQVGHALRASTAQLRGLPLAGVVLFSDGASNKGEDPKLTAKRLGEQDIPVFAVGVGAPEAVDVAVLNADIPDLIFAGDELAVRTAFSASALAGAPLPVEIRLNDTLVGKGETIARNGVFEDDIVMKPTVTGDVTVSVSVPQQPGETVVENNVFTKRIRVIDSAIRILIAVETPSWEYRYLTGFLDSDKRIETDVLIRRGDLRRIRAEESMLERFPDWETLKREYDVLILNNIEADYFSRQNLEDIRRFVAEEGGALIMTAAPRGTPASFLTTPVADMLPVQADRITENAATARSKRFSTGFPLKLTREGRQHIIPRLKPLPEENAELWRSLPEQYWYYTGIRRAKPGATVLVEHGEKRNEYGPLPLMAIQPFGRGQVLFIGFNSIWRWRFEIGNRYTSRFWGQTIQYLGLPHLLGSLKRVQFQVTSREGIAGEPLDLGVRLFTPEFQPLERSQIEVLATAEDGRQEAFTFSPRPGQPGSYSGRLILPEGTWNVQVAGMESEETLVLDIIRPRYELLQPAQQQDELQAIAEASGGAYLTLGDLAGLPDLIADSIQPARRDDAFDLWDTWLALLIIVVSTTIEWTLRKWRDLP